MTAVDAVVFAGDWTNPPALVSLISITLEVAEAEFALQPTGYDRDVMRIVSRAS